MVRRKGKFRRKTRSKLRKRRKDRGKLSISKYFQKFKIGDRVYLKAEPAIQKGMYHPRYHGKSAKIINKKGNCYEVLINDQKKEKKLIVHPIHLKKA